VRGTASDVRVEVALAWTDASDCAVRSFCGQNLTKDGGTHERGFWDAVVHAVSALHRSTHGGPRPRGVRPKIAPGLLAAVHVGLYAPQFGGPTRDRITSPEAADAVRAVLTPALRDHLTAHPALAQRLLARLAP
jgi:DNA gyrase/topoisomerase IV subunit B